MAYSFGAPKIVTDGLVLYLDAANHRSYPGSGTSWNDLSGNGNHGTLTNGPTFSSDNAGSLVFDGTNDYIQTSYGNGRNVATNPISVAAWVKSNTTTGQRMWFDVGSNGTNQRFYSALNTTSTNNMGIQGNPWYLGIPDDMEWHYQAVVMDGDTAIAYDNGVQVHTKSYTSYSLPGNLRFGGRTYYYWEGYISLSKIYNRALSPQEVLQNYNATKARYNL